jgi:HAD superfamily hydrolase (TIGR01509 family)
MAALIFDFDGVIADSEALANLVLAEHVSALGKATTLDEALALYSGRRWADAMAEIERRTGAALPEDFSARLQAATLERFRAELKEVAGAARFIRRFAGLPRSIASSSSMERLRACLRLLNLEETFEGRVFSADLVARGKPHPDIFLFAADRMGVSPGECLVIEDSPGGIRAAVAAGMISIGLVAASHIRPGREAALHEAGAPHIAATWEDAGKIVVEVFGLDPSW